MGRQRISMTPLAANAAKVLGQQVRFARQERQWTVADLAARAGVSAGTVSAVEKGAPTTAIGNVLNVAAAAGVPLFSLSAEELSREVQTGRDRLALIPTRVDPPKGRADVDLDF